MREYAGGLNKFSANAETMECRRSGLGENEKNERTKEAVAEQRNESRRIVPNAAHT